MDSESFLNISRSERWTLDRVRCTEQTFRCQSFKRFGDRISEFAAQTIGVSDGDEEVYHVCMYVLSDEGVRVKTGSSILQVQSRVIRSVPGSRHPPATVSYY
jgi:hypothetical protein